MSDNRSSPEHKTVVDLEIEKKNSQVKHLYKYTHLSNLQLLQLLHLSDVIWDWTSD